MDLTQAILHTDSTLLKQILQITPNINYLDEYGYTPLIQAVIMNHFENTKLLLEHGADPNQKDLTGRTALHWAVSNDHFELSKLLLHYQSDPNSYNIASEPILAKAMMRGNIALKNILVEHGGSTTFANDYIKVKLLGHRYELIGSVDIVDPKGIFTEVDYEGFYLESSIDLIRYSLNEFRDNFASRAIYNWFDTINTIYDALTQAQQLLKQDHYLATQQDQLQAIHRFLMQNTFILPINQQGHAFSVVKSGNLLAIIDRAKDSLPNDRIPIYYINRKAQLTAQLIYPIAFERQDIQMIHQTLKQTLALQEIESLPIPDQRIGNCSWANIEATIPTLKLMMNFHGSGTAAHKNELIADSLELFHRWRHWDRERALNFVIDDFKLASNARKACIAALLAAILFQHCSATNDEHFILAERIIPIVTSRDYEYLINSYKKFYLNDKPTKAGANLLALLERYKRESV